MSADLSAAAAIFDANEANFENDVLNASFDRPVLVDFWATWCGPCKTLGPLIEKLVGEYHGALHLAKVDCDKEQQLAAMFGVRSIPTVVLMRDGRLVDGFSGALAEGQLREFLERHVGPPGAMPAEEAPPPVVEESPEQAIARIQQEMAADPDKAELKLDLAVAEMRAGNVAATEAELESLPANLATDDRATRLRGQIAFARSIEGAPAADALRARIDKDPSDLQARDLLGVRLLLDGDTEAALETFLSILKSDREWQEGRAKKRLVDAFNVIDDAELVGTYRRKMSSLLF